MERIPVEQKIDELLSDFDVTKPTSKWADKDTVTFWIPRSYKTKYAEIQARSGRQFSKKIQEMLMFLIDQVDLEDEAAKANQ